MEIPRFAGIALMLLLLFLFYPAFAFDFPQDSIQNSLTNEQIEKGRNLFTGKTRFSNGGISCISCHSLDDPELPVSGGTYSLNITAFGGLPEDALKLRIIEISLPHMTEMKTAFKGRPVTEEESELLIAYLNHVSQLDVEPEGTVAPLHAKKFLWPGLIGVILIYGAILLMWRGRKKHSVNRRIYQRQVKSV